MFRRKKQNLLLHLLGRLRDVIAVVLIWRGIWFILDEIDRTLFGQSHVFTALAGVALGLFLLFIPDHDLKEIQNH